MRDAEVPAFVMVEQGLDTLLSKHTGHLFHTMWVVGNLYTSGMLLEKLCFGLGSVNTVGTPNCSQQVYPGKAETISCVVSRPGYRLEQLGVWQHRRLSRVGLGRLQFLCTNEVFLLKMDSQSLPRQFSRSYSLSKVKDVVVSKPKPWSSPHAADSLSQAGELSRSYSVPCNLQAFSLLRT